MLLRREKKREKGDVEDTEEKEVVRPKINLDEGAYIADGEGKIIGKSVEEDKKTTEILKFMLSIREKRKGIAVLCDERTSIVVPLWYEEMRGGRTREGVGIFISSKSDGILNSLNRALDNIKEEANSITGGFVSFHESVQNIYNQAQEIEENEARISIGHALYKLALGENVIKNPGAIFTANALDNFTLYACHDYNPRVAGWDFDIVVNNTGKEMIDEKFSGIFEEVYPFNIYPVQKLKLRDLVEQALKKSSKSEFSKELVEFYVKNNKIEKILEMHNRKLILNEDIPLDLKIDDPSFKLTSEDVIGYIQDVGEDPHQLVKLFKRIPPTEIIKVASKFNEDKKRFSCIKKAINSYLEYKVAMEECSEEKYLALLEFAEEEISKKVIEIFLFKPVKDRLKTLQDEYGLSFKVEFSLKKLHH